MEEASTSANWRKSEVFDDSLGVDESNRNFATKFRNRVPNGATCWKCDALKKKKKSYIVKLDFEVNLVINYVCWTPTGHRFVFGMNFV